MIDLAPLADGHQIHGRSLKQLLARRDMRQHAARCRVPMPSMDHTDPAAPPALARVNHGRWIADCPAPRCNGAMSVFLDTPWFWCSSCGNADIGGVLRPVLLPGQLQIERITAVLEARPSPENRNWEPGELIGRLKNENKAHGKPWAVAREEPEP